MATFTFPPGAPRCALCDKLVDRIIYETFKADRKLVITVHCHGETEDTVMYETQAQSILPEDEFKWADAFVTPRLS